MIQSAPCTFGLMLLSMFLSVYNFMMLFLINCFFLQLFYLYGIIIKLFNSCGFSCTYSNLNYLITILSYLNLIIHLLFISLLQEFVRVHDATVSVFFCKIMLYCSLVRKQLMISSLLAFLVFRSFKSLTICNIFSSLLTLISSWNIVADSVGFFD